MAVLVDDDDSGFMKVGESGEGMYSINFNRIVYSLLATTMHSIVQERFGSQSARIFRYLFPFTYLLVKVNVYTTVPVTVF